MKYVRGEAVKLIQLPTGKFSRELPLTIGKFYKIMGTEGSNVIITTDDPTTTGSISHTRVEKIVLKTN